MKEITEEEFAEMARNKRSSPPLEDLQNMWPATPVHTPKQVPLEAVVKTLGGILAARALLWVNTAAAAGLFGLAIHDPQPMKLVAAAGYAGLVYLPMLLWRREV